MVVPDTPRTIVVAAAQLDVAVAHTPHDVQQRLDRAEALVARAAAGGAQLVALPEMFNIGYSVLPEAFPLAERADGRTANWLRAVAARYNVLVVGSVLLQDEEDVFNSALLAAPDGTMWRYDKQFPWLFEHANVRAGSRLLVAHTALGRVGVMICTEATRPALWLRYAGRVQLMVVLPTPVAFHKATVVLADGTRVRLSGRGMFVGADEPFGADLDATAAWMRVPLVVGGTCGVYESALPRPALTLLGVLAGRPRLWPLVWQRPAQARVLAASMRQAKVVGADGVVRARVTSDVEDVALAGVVLPPHAPIPEDEPPSSPYTPAYFALVGPVAQAVYQGVYRAAVRAQFGTRMAPARHGRRVWQVLTVGALTLGWWAGRVARRQARR